jgi:hypothetical protein
MSFFLCVCQYGHSRSVALAREFHKRGFNAVAVGVGTAGKEAIAALSEQAIRICVLEPHYENAIPVEDRNRVWVFNVGRDKWSNPYSPELAGILSKMLDERMLSDTDVLTAARNH